jgi:molybdenum-dependent DNA-binding transcriptional regulator ModE
MRWPVITFGFHRCEDVISQPTVYYEQTDEERRMKQGIAGEPSESGGRRKRGGIGHLIPEIVLTTEDGQITLRQLELLKAVSSERSQNRAAEKLGISTAVLNRQLREMEKRAGTKLLDTTKRGSELTAEGRQLLRVLGALNRRMTRQKELIVGCTSVSQAIAERICSKLTMKGKKVRLIVADDETNISMSMSGLLDVIFVDDPRFAYEYPKEGRVHEVTKDFLIQCDRGEGYAVLTSGPQRIGFDVLRQESKPFKVKATVFSPEELLASKHSFFVSKMLLSDRRIDLPQSAKLRRIPYTIYAIETTDHADIAAFFDCMAPEQYYPIG